MDKFEKQLPEHKRQEYKENIRSNDIRKSKALFLYSLTAALAATIFKFCTGYVVVPLMAQVISLLFAAVGGLLYISSRHFR